MSGFWIGLGIAVAGFFVCYGLGQVADRMFELSQEIMLARHDRLRGRNQP